MMRPFFCLAISLVAAWAGGCGCGWGCVAGRGAGERPWLGARLGAVGTHAHTYVPTHAAGVLSCKHVQPLANSSVRPGLQSDDNVVRARATAHHMHINHAHATAAARRQPGQHAGAQRTSSAPHRPTWVQ